MKNEKIERRFSGKVEFRVKEDNPQSRTIFGYAAVFNKVSDLGYFSEEIDPAFFDDVLKDDVRALFNHDANLPLSRTGAGLTIGKDKTGLWYEFEAPNTTAGNDLLENVRMGIIKESSFSFLVKEEKWTDMGKGKPMKRTLLKAEQLIDVSPVTFPAYEDTEVGCRSLDQFKKSLNNDDYKADLAAMDIEKMKSELRKAS